MVQFIKITTKVIFISIAWICFEIFLNVYEAAYFISLPTVKVGVKSWVKTWQIIACGLVLALTYCLVNFSTQFGLVSLYVFPVLTIIYSFVFVRGDVINKLFWFIFPDAMITCFDIFSCTIVMLIFQVPVESVMEQGSYRLLFILIAKLMHTFIWIYLMSQDREKIQSGLRYIAILITSFLLTSTLVILVMSGTIDSLNSSALFNMIPPLLLSIGLCLLFAFRMIYKKNLKDKQSLLELCSEKEILLNQAETVKKNYSSEIVNAYEAVRQFRYDVLNHLQDMWPAADVQANTMQKYLEAFELINQQVQIKYQTGNELVDVVLAVKESAAFQSGIAIHVEGEIKPKFIKSEDLCVLLDYLLTKAIQEVNLVDDRESANAILVTFINNASTLVIKIENPVPDSRPLKLLSSIQEIVRRYHGYFSGEQEEFYREVVVALHSIDFEPGIYNY